MRAWCGALVVGCLIGCGPGVDDPDQMRKAFSKRMAAKIKKEGEDFLKQNAAKPGMTVLPSGVQYRVLSSGPGAGNPPKKTNYVTVHYRGTLIDGTEFDSTIAQKKPTSIRLDKTIPGWIEVLHLMRPGDKWQVFIPAHLGYDDKEKPDIPAHSALIFEVELISVER